MAEYNPQSRYTWKPEDKFEITGQQFGLILNMVRSYLSSEDAGKFMMMQQTNDVIEGIMKQGVESGVIVESPEEKPPVQPTPLKAVE
tara:strand:- start:74 stop:334 length:261 start_codon:yes stop_codon:yes gene_type:complete